MSAYGGAIDLTVRTIEHRARYFRNQIVVVVAISILVVFAAVLTRSVAVLWAWLVLIPICGRFFYADIRLLNKWRFELLTPWTARELDFAAFLESIRANPMLPKGTTEGMLVTLPSCGELVGEQRIPSPTRRAIAAAARALYLSRADQLLGNVAASAIVVAVLLAALWMRSWSPLLGLATLTLLPLVRWMAARRRQALCDAEVAVCRAQVGFSEADYVRIRSGIC